MSFHALVRTKLHPPVVGRDTMTRARLFGRLEYRRPLTLVVAPAGYGKTTLVVDWLGHAGSPFAWLSLDAYDDNLGLMLDRKG